MSSLPSLDSTTTRTRDTSDKHQLTNNFARIFLYLADCPVLFFKICEDELSWCFALCKKITIRDS